MLGGIYTTQKCPVCGQTMRDNHRDAVSCAKHRSQRATRIFVRFTRQVMRWFSGADCYEQASRFLTGLRYKHDEGTFDPRDYAPRNPLGFDVLATKYLLIKKKTVAPGSYKVVKPRIMRAMDWFGSRNVKDITYGDMEDFLLAQEGLADKTKADLLAQVKTFYNWLVKRREIRIDQMPEFPTVQYELGWRRTVDKSTQREIIEEVRRLTWRSNPRIYIGIRFLATYIHVRPGELLGVLEEDIDLNLGLMIIHHHKTRKKSHSPKVVPLIEADIEVIRSLPRGFPKMPFFRYEKGIGGRPVGSAFGQHVLLNTWKRACSNLGIKGVDLYGGTRHSSAQALREHLSPESIRKLTGHQTSKAFERYYQTDIETLRKGYQLTSNPKGAAITVLSPKSPDPT